MKKNWRNRLRHPGWVFSNSGFRLITFVTLLLGMIVLGACKNENTSHEHDTYTCPMHPTVISDRPGTCPVCGMDLVRKAREGEEVEITGELAHLLKSPSETVVASVKVIRGDYGVRTIQIKAQGIVTYDTRNIHSVSARTGGRLEKFTVKYPFQKIAKGQKVAEVYSPEMVTAQRELLYLIENDPANESLIQGARQRLSLLGASASQIAKIITSREAEYSFAIYSPHEGYVLAESQQAPAAIPTPVAGSGAGSMSGGMGSNMSGDAISNSTSSRTVAAEISLREGDYVNAGQTLFKIVDPSMLRVELNVPVSQSNGIAKGAAVSLDFGDGKITPAKVDFIQPFFNEGEEFLTVRIYTKDVGSLTIGQLVRATIESHPVEGLWVPKKAVLDLGSDRIVFAKVNGVFKPKPVIVGPESKGMVRVSGLASSEEIAANAQYMVDSESFIRIDK